jgi:tRNA (cmo5U34)-methyltransferase
LIEDHFDPDVYPETVQAEIPDYDRIQDLVAEAGAGLEAERILDLGAGTGETALRVLERQPRAAIVLVDASERMLRAARTALPAARIEAVRVQRLEAALPPGPFDLVVSALAIHHLTSADKRDLFGRIAAVLRPGGRFVLADVVVPRDGEPTPFPSDPGFDQPDPLDDQLAWLAEAGLETRVIWSRDYLAVLQADRR